jgi:hypothetical protein
MAAMDEAHHISHRYDEELKEELKAAQNWVLTMGEALERQIDVALEVRGESVMSETESAQ